MLEVVSMMNKHYKGKVVFWDWRLFIVNNIKQGFGGLIIFNLKEVPNSDFYGRQPHLNFERVCYEFEEYFRISKDYLLFHHQGSG